MCAGNIPNPDLLVRVRCCRLAPFPVPRRLTVILWLIFLFKSKQHNFGSEGRNQRNIISKGAKSCR